MVIFPAGLFFDFDYKFRIMFQWKNIQLSPEDYENYVHNEDEAQMLVNNLNITKLQWSQLYHNVQQRSQHNKAIKKSVLAYQSNIKRLFLQENGHRPRKEIQKMYEKQNNELRIYISQLFDQINLLHIRNIATTIQFSFSRILNLQQQLIGIICSQQQQIATLKQEKERLQLNRSSQLCVICHEETQKNRNKLLVRQVFACNQPALLLEEQQKMELSQTEKVQKINREQAKRQENEYEIQRLCYLNSVQEVLRNREKILKCTSAPLQNLLSQYLTQILQMLEQSNIPFSQKNIKEYDRVNKSYETIDDMKASINTENFYKKVSLLLEKPYQNLVENIERYVKYNANYKGNVKKTTVQTQTTYLTEIDQIKGLQKKTSELHFELEHIKKSKSKNELNLINNMESMHRIQIKYIQSVNKNKNLQAENKKLEAQITQLKSQLKQAKEDHIADQNRILQMNQVQKGWLQREVKRLQLKVRTLQQKNEYYINCEKGQQQIQTQFNFLKENMITFNQQSDNAFQTNEKIMTQRRSQKKSQRKIRKRTTIRMQELQRNQPLPQISHYNHSRHQSLESNLPPSKNNIPFLEVSQPHRTEIRTKTFKLFTLDPSEKSGDTLIHRVSSRKISPIRVKQTQPLVQYELSAGNSATMSPAHHKMRMKKVPESKLKHKHHPTEVIIRKKAQKQQAQTVNTIKQQAYTVNNMQKSQFKRQNSTIIDQFFQQTGTLAKQQKQNSNPTAINVRKQKKPFQQPTYSCRIHQPVDQMSLQAEDPTITELLENVKTIAYPNLKQQIKKLLKFSIANYQFLIERNIFSLLYDMGTEKRQKSEQRKGSRLICNDKKGNNEQIEHTIDVQCKRIGKRCMQIFFNMEEAYKYEKKMGIWEQYEAFIVIDNNFSKQCEKIQQFFNNLKESQPMLYQEAILFLEKPFYFCQQIEGKDYQTKQITIFRESLKMFELQKNWIKKLFEKLMKLHRLLHKNCNHVQKFLNIIGFK